MDPVARILPDGKRLHLHHGPSDLILFAEGDDADQRERAYKAAIARFQTIIAEVVEELPLLRAFPSPVSASPNNSVARRMVDAATPFARLGFVTPMAAVAGAIADEVLAAMTRNAALTRAYVNNGGDIAFHLTDGTTLSSAICAHDGRSLGRVDVTAQDPVRGLATSGRHGRSLSCGIADSVTVLAPSAAKADVAATMVANAVDLPGHPAISRSPASDIIDDSDLGDLSVVTGCGALSRTECSKALQAGSRRAQMLHNCGEIDGAALFLQDQSNITGATLFHPFTNESAYA